MKCLFTILVMLYNTHPHPLLNSNKILKMARYTCKYSEQYDMDPVLILSVQKHESNYRYKVKSKTNDCGLMQINDPDGDCRKGCDLKEISCNIWYGTRFLSRIKSNCIRKHEHTHWLKHYNWGSKYHHWRVLWLVEAFKKAYASQSLEIYKVIRRRIYPIDFPRCIMRNDLCIQDKNPSKWKSIYKKSNRDIHI